MQTASRLLTLVRRVVSLSQAGTMATDAPFGWKDRAARLDEIDRDRICEADRLWAIRALRDEAALVQRKFLRTNRPLSEEYGTYYIDLGLFVARLRDPRAAEALTAATHIGPKITAALVDLGDAAVDPLLRALRDRATRRNAAYALAKLLHSGRLSPENAARIERVIAQ